MSALDLLFDRSTGDLADLVNGDLAMASGADAVDQYCWQALNLIQGEWFLDETAGVPYLDQVFVKGVSPVVLGAVFKNYIIELPNISEVTKFALTPNKATRGIAITFDATTDDGDPISFSETVGGV